MGDVDRWLRGARAGDELVYAHGDYLSDWGGTARHIGRLARGYAVHPFPRRSGADGRLDFVARRTRIGLAAAGVVPHRIVVPLSDRAGVLLDLIEEAVARGEPCPSNRDFGAALGGASDHSVYQSLRELKLRGLIAVEMVDLPGQRWAWRKAVVLASGAATAKPEGLA